MAYMDYGGTGRRMIVFSVVACLSSLATSVATAIASVTIFFENCARFVERAVGPLTFQDLHWHLQPADAAMPVTPAVFKAIGVRSALDQYRRLRYERD